MFEPTLSPDGVRSLLAAAGRTRNPRRDCATLAVLLDTGPRRGDFVALGPEDLDLGRGLLCIGNEDLRRCIRLGERTLALVRSTPELIEGLGGPVMTDRTVQELLKRLGVAAGLGSHITCRLIRRTWLSRVAASQPLPVVLRLAGHRARRVHPATLDQALAAQLALKWKSPLEEMLEASQPFTAAA